LLTDTVVFINRKGYRIVWGWRLCLDRKIKSVSVRIMSKDVIGFRVRSEVKTAWEQLTENDKNRVRIMVEELILLHASGYSVELIKRELDSLRAEICPALKKIVEAYEDAWCINRCSEDWVKSYFYKLYYIINYKLCNAYPVKPQNQGVST